MLQQVTQPKDESAHPEPEQVQEVFIAQPVGANSVALKTHKSCALSCDKFGIITAEREAVGPQEEWIPIFRPDGIAFQSVVHEKFLKADVEKGILRADSDTVGYLEVFAVFCQAARKKAKKKKADDANSKSYEEIEVENL